MHEIVRANPVPQHAHGNGRAVRQHNQTLRYVDQRAAVSVRQVENIHHVARLAMFETMQTGMARRTAELAVPDQADLLQAINFAAGFATVNIISGMQRG